MQALPDAPALRRRPPVELRRAQATRDRGGLLVTDVNFVEETCGPKRRGRVGHASGYTYRPPSLGRPLGLPWANLKVCPTYGDGPQTVTTLSNSRTFGATLVPNNSMLVISLSCGSVPLLYFM